MCIHQCCLQKFTSGHLQLHTPIFQHAYQLSSLKSFPVFKVVQFSSVAQLFWLFAEDPSLYVGNEVAVRVFWGKKEETMRWPGSDGGRGLEKGTDMMRMTFPGEYGKGWVCGMWRAWHVMGAWREGQVWSWVDWAFSLTLLIWSDGETPRDRYS